ncbi:MAG: hypothetical protein KA419_00255 [Acidobacteria bacterium]|nr:hypothetical protein [Acidobacteriota bacterium]
MLALCPHCGKPIRVDEPGWVQCRHCDRKGWVPDPMNPDAGPPPEEPPPDPLPAEPAAAVGEAGTEVVADGEAAPHPSEDRAPIPWEDGPAGGGLARFFRTLGAVLFHPRAFFTALPGSRPSRRVRGFGFIVIVTGLVGHFASQYLSLKFFEYALSARLLDPPMDEVARSMLDTLRTLRIDGGFFLVSSVLSPLCAWVVLWFTTNLLALSCALRAAQTPNEAMASRIVRLTGYVYAPWVFLVVFPLGVLWGFLLFAAAARFALGFTWPRALLTSLANLLFLSFFYETWVRLHVWLAT